jgi:hypothetical protein
LNASSDNVAEQDTSIQGTTLKATVTSTSYAVTGLTAKVPILFCKSKDAAGNISASSTAVNVTTLSNALTYCASKEIL